MSLERVTVNLLEQSLSGQPNRRNNNKSLFFDVCFAISFKGGHLFTQTFVWWMLKAYLRDMFTEILGLWIGVSKSLLLDFTPLLHMFVITHKVEKRVKHLFFSSTSCVQHVVCWMDICRMCLELFKVVQIVFQNYWLS